jgi:hypothetical protein
VGSKSDNKKTGMQKRSLIKQQGSHREHLFAMGGIGASFFIFCFATAYSYEQCRPMEGYLPFDWNKTYSK